MTAPPPMTVDDYIGLGFAIAAEIWAMVYLIVIRRNNHDRRRYGCSLKHLEWHDWENYNPKSNRWGKKYCLICGEEKKRFKD